MPTPRKPLTVKRPRGGTVTYAAGEEVPEYVAASLTDEEQREYFGKQITKRKRRKKT